METTHHFITQVEACEIVGVSGVTMWRIIKRCGLTAARRGRDLLLYRSQVMRVAQLKKVAPGAAITPEIFWSDSKAVTVETKERN